jgi:hypothetical protein
MGSTWLLVLRVCKFDVLRVCFQSDVVHQLSSDMLFLQAIAVLTNSSDWEFYVYRPLADPPVVYWEITTPTEMLWKDLAKLRQRFMCNGWTS